MASFGHIFDAATVEPATPFEIFPPGKYRGQLVASEMRPTKVGMGQYLLLELDVLDRRLAESPNLAGDEYTIADMSVWPWYGALVKGQVYEAGEFLQVQDYKNVLRWTDRIAQRPAAQRGRMVNRTWGAPASQLQERHDASDFELKTQDKVAPA